MLLNLKEHIIHCIAVFSQNYTAVDSSPILSSFKQVGMCGSYTGDQTSVRKMVDGFPRSQPIVHGRVSYRGGCYWIPPPPPR